MIFVDQQKMKRFDLFLFVCKQKQIFLNIRISALLLLADEINICEFKKLIHYFGKMLISKNRTKNTTGTSKPHFNAQRDPRVLQVPLRLTKGIIFWPGAPGNYDSMHLQEFNLKQFA